VVSTSEERIPADQFARRYGWRTSAVIHRIRAGIYDGFRDGDTWYVVDKAAYDDLDSDVARKKAYKSDSTTSYPELPWKTVPGPLGWVSWVVWSILGVIAVVIYTDGAESVIPVVGFGMFASSTAVLYEAFRTGTIRNRGFPRNFTHSPIQYSLLAATYAMLALVGLVILIRELIEWLSAA
jgi:hypothetical protein